MKHAILVAILAAWIWAPQGSARAQNLLEGGAIAPLEYSVPAEAPDAPIYADGVRAINAGRWSDAIAIFSRIGPQSSDHADGALFWKAYAENKLGQGSKALEDCGRLRAEHSASKWIDECGALEIDIKGKSGQPVSPQAQQSDDLKLLALAALMQHDEKLALKEIDNILNSDAPEKLKQGALFIMSEHHTDTMYPQIARLSYVEGDVRIARGEKKKHDKNSGWEQAAVDLPLETGYSLVTGNGRAEIELEDASTIYLAENSVLTLNDLHTVGGIPYTDAALLTGTVTLHVKPYVAGESFVLHMPTDGLMTRYPQVTDLRVSSYTDGIAITSLGNGTLGLTGAKCGQVLGLGQTYYFKDGKRTIDAGPIQPPDFSAWDKWVADRYTERSAAMAEMLKASGLATPLPGMAEMQGKGTFVDCQPYGTCWEPPAAPATGQVAQANPPDEKPVESGPDTNPQNSPPPGTQPARNIKFVGKPTPAQPPAQWADMISMFPCVPGEVQAQMILSLYPGTSLTSFRSAYWDPPRWAWAVCHAGTWIYRKNRYMWVAGRPHHHPPVHWIRYGNRVAFVPTHPRDVKDQPPVNHKNPVFVVSNKDGRVIEKIDFPTGHPVELLKDPPRGLRTSYAPPLQRAEEPRMAAHSLKDLQTARSTAVRSAPVAITFNHKTQTFMTSRQEVHSGRTVTVNAPMENHSGTLQSHAGGFGGGAGNGWAHGGSAGGGGGVHSGGGSSGSSSGGSHSGGSTSSSSSGSSASSSSSGGSHH